MRERWNLAALAMAGACYLKLYPLAVSMLLVLIHPKRLGWRFALAMLAGLALPFALQHPSFVWDQYEAWFWLLKLDERGNFKLDEGYRDFFLLARWMGYKLPPNMYMTLQLAAAAAIAGLCAWGRASGWTRQHVTNTVTVLGCGWLVVFGPATESCTYILIAPGLAWAVVDAFANRRSIFTRAICTLVLAMLLLNGMVTWFPFARHGMYIVQPVAGLLFFVERFYFAFAYGRAASTPAFTPKGFDLRAQGKRSAALGNVDVGYFYPEGVRST